jgi:hypothetical protein
MTTYLQVFADKLASLAIMERMRFGREGGRKGKLGERPGSFINKLSAEEREKVRQLKPEHFKTALRKYEMHQGNLEESRRFKSDLLCKFDQELIKHGYKKSELK